MLFWNMMLAMVAGFCLPVQAGINARLAVWTRSSILAATVSFAVGTLSLLAYAFLLRIPWPEIALAGRQPWWTWTGGCIGAFFVASTVVLAPRLGAAPMVALVVAGQMLISVGLDHFGLLGYTLHPMNGWRIFGVALMIGGVVFIQLF
ncbi:MAG: DMT family transporter [Deltaproteobacteria bacterium]|nr:DMT family transporter [Deltaproteobacteria bacterium]MBW1956382.1 DMT family transporter [Deltaproteobacteria bacterium]MBW2131272.1 DMT family transporter [Deltaproteobacteria bacterium]